MPVTRSAIANGRTSKEASACGSSPPAGLDGGDLTKYLKLREGRWKLLLDKGEPKRFDLASDLGEAAHLADQDRE